MKALMTEIGDLTEVVIRVSRQMIYQFMGVISAFATIFLIRMAWGLFTNEETIYFTRFDRIALIICFVVLAVYSIGVNFFAWYEIFDRQSREIIVAMSTSLVFATVATVIVITLTAKEDVMNVVGAYSLIAVAIYGIILSIADSWFRKGPLAK